MITERRAFTVVRSDRQSPATDGAVLAAPTRGCEPSVYVMARSCRSEGGVGRSGTSGLSERRREIASRWIADASEGNVPRSPAPTVRGGGR